MRAFLIATASKADDSWLGGHCGWGQTVAGPAGTSLSSQVRLRLGMLICLWNAAAFGRSGVSGSSCQAVGLMLKTCSTLAVLASTVASAAAALGTSPGKLFPWFSYDMSSVTHEYPGKHIGCHEHRVLEGLQGYMGHAVPNHSALAHPAFDRLDYLAIYCGCLESCLLQVGVKNHDSTHFRVTKSLGSTSIVCTILRLSTCH